MDRLYEKNVTVFIGATADNPQTDEWPLEDNYLVWVEILIPPGHAGLTGIRLSRAGTPIVPYSFDSWIISDDEKLTISFNGEITATGLTIETYNTDGVFSHTFYLRALVRDLRQSAQVSPIQPSIPSDIISSIQVAGP